VALFQFSFTLNDDDYFEYSKYDLLHDPIGKQTLFEQRLFPPLLLLSFFVRAYRENNARLVVIFIVILFILSIFWIAFAKSFLFRRMKRNIGIQKKLGKLPYPVESTLVFENNFYRLTTPEYEITAKYSEIEFINEAKNYIYIYRNVSQAHIIPLHVFADDEEKARFVAFIESKIAKK